MWNYASSVLSTVNVGSGIQLLDESVAKLVTAGLDETKSDLAKTPIQGSKHFVVKNVDKNNIVSKKIHGIGLAKVNSDGAALPVDKQVMGFEQTITSYTIRNSMSLTREVLRNDRHGEIGQHTRNLLHSGKKTTERLLADMPNRGFGTTSLSALGEDGLAMFSASHPFARASAGTWSNLATGGLTADALGSARLNLRQYIDLNGDLSPQQLVKVVVSPTMEDTMRELTGSALKVDTSLNTINKVAGTKYEVWDWLTGDKVIYIGDGQNEMEFHILDAPETKTWQDGNNPDVINSRLRMSVGTGIKCPGNMIGHTVT